MISTRSMELLRSWGLEREVLAGGVDADVWLWECDTLATAAEGKAHAVGYPSCAQAQVVSPCSPGTVPQDWLVDVLRRHVATLPTTRFELGNRARRDRRRTRRGARDATRPVGRGAHGACAPTSSPPTARTARSENSSASPCTSTRGAYGGVQVVFRAPLWDLLGDLRYGLYVVTTPEAPGLFLPAGRDRWVYGPDAAG